MKSLHNKIICLTMALFILLSGMCLEIPKADSLFACINKSESTSYVSSPGGTLENHELSGSEYGMVQHIAFISSAPKKTALRVIVRNVVILFWAELFSLRASNLQKAVETVCAPETHYFTALLNYIHKQDGKK